MATDEPRTHEVKPLRAQILATLWSTVFHLKRNGRVIVFNHLRARIVWIGIMDVRATEEELVDLLPEKQ